MIKGIGTESVQDASNTLATLPTWQLITSTFAWCGGIGLGATLLGIPGAWLLRKRPWSLPIILIPLVLPSYFVYGAANLLRAPGTWLGDWSAAIGEGGQVWVPVVLGRVLAAISLMLWLWPLASIALAPSVSRIGQSEIDSARIDGAPAYSVASLFMFANRTRGGLLCAWCLCSIVLIGSPIPLHVAQVPTLCMHIWAVLVQNPGDATAWLSAWPLCLCAVGGGVLVSRAMHANQANTYDASAITSSGGSGATGSVVIVLLLCSVVLPYTLFFRYLHSPREVNNFVSLNSSELIISALTSLCVAIGAAGLGCLAWLFRSTQFSRSNHGGGALAILIVTIWASLLLAPGVLIGAAVSQVLQSSRIFSYVEIGAVSIAHLLRYGALAVCTGWFLASSEDADVRASRTLDTGGGLRGFITLCFAPRWPILAAASFAIAMLSLHDIDTTILLQPAGLTTLPQLLLSYLHFFRTEELSAAMIVLISACSAPAVALSWIASRTMRR